MEKKLKLTDESVQDTIKKLESQLKELKSQQEKFVPVTNMNLELFAKRYNLHVSDFNELNFLHEFLSVITSSVVISGYTISQWLQDISTKRNLLVSKENISKLEKAHKRLIEMYSPEMQNQIEFDNILKLINE